MPSVRTSFSLDAVADHDLIKRLAELQREGKASTEIRAALREHFNMQPTLSDVMTKLDKLEQLLLSRKVAPVKTPVLHEDIGLDTKLDKTLARFRRN